MRPRTLIMTLVLVGAFWLITSHGNWSVERLMRPIASISSSGKLWTDPVTAHGAGGFGADEQNNIDIYKSSHLATVNITSVVYQRNMFFQVLPFVMSDDGHRVPTSVYSTFGTSQYISFIL